MKTSILGYPRIGKNRELKKSIENYWKKNITEEKLAEVASNIRKDNWETQSKLKVDLISSNDFSLYDQVLDMCITLGCIPERHKKLEGLEQYFAMARGLQKNDIDVTPMEMTKWFNTNYHYIVPEFKKNQVFSLNSKKILKEYQEALALDIKTKPVIIGPVTFLMIGKEKEEGFNRLDLLPKLLPIYQSLLKEVSDLGAEYIQIDEPILSTELNTEEKKLFITAYDQLAQAKNGLKIIVANYFDSYGENLDFALKLPIEVLHLDLSTSSAEITKTLNSSSLSNQTILSLGLVDGRNIWKNDFEYSLNIINKVEKKIGSDRLWISSSCSLLHSPYDLDLEENPEKLNPEIKQWLAFSKQKVQEIVQLKSLALNINEPANQKVFEENKKSKKNRQTSSLIHNVNVKKRVENLTEKDSSRESPFKVRQQKQKRTLQLPLFPTTTIGSFPQTKEVRKKRAQFKNKKISQLEYDQFLESEITETIHFQEEIGLDVLVHGEFERNDMVEYFGEKLDGFAFTHLGWVQSYGTRCVKPPIIFGDISRPRPMTVKWSSFAQSITDKLVKGMLTGPVTILQWSFVRNDQSKSITCKQIALAIRDEVCDLEKAGLKIIQIDEPAIREGLPLKKKEWATYLDWAIKAFRISASGIQDQTQIHTHMCYSEFNDIIANIADMDADVITIETSRSEMDLLHAFVDFKYPNEIGPGVYDIHSPRVPTQLEIEELLKKAADLLPVANLWVNPDCGLKTRDWPETKAALKNLVKSAKKMRALYS